MTETTKPTTVTRRRFLVTAAGVVPAVTAMGTVRPARAQRGVTLTVVVPEHWKVTEGIQQKSATTVPPRRLWYFERIMEWDKAFPEIKLEHQSVTWEQIAPKFIAASLAGNPPDIITVDGNELPALATGGFLHPLNDFKYDQWPDFNKDIVDYCTIDGKIYAMSFYVGLWLYYANQKLLKAAGIGQPAKTWPEVISQAKLLTKDTRGLGRPDQWGFGMTMSGVAFQQGPSHLAQIVWSQGGDVADAKDLARIDTKEMAQAFQLVADLVNTHKVMARDVLTMPNNGMIDLFNTERWATGILHSSFYPPAVQALGKDAVGVAPFPVFPGGRSYGTVEVFIASISAKAGKDPGKREAAWELIKHFGANETLWAAAKHQFGMPVRKSAAGNAVYTQDPMLKFLSQYTVDHGRPIPHIKDVRFYFEVLLAAVAGAVLGRTTIPAALQEAQRKYDERVKRA
jgi:multiple sugar transport system substrate-binding protein